MGERGGACVRGRTAPQLQQGGARAMRVLRGALRSRAYVSRPDHVLAIVYRPASTGTTRRSVGKGQRSHTARQRIKENQLHSFTWMRARSATSCAGARAHAVGAVDERAAPGSLETVRRRVLENLDRIPDAAETGLRKVWAEYVFLSRFRSPQEIFLAAESLNLASAPRWFNAKAKSLVPGPECVDGRRISSSAHLKASRCQGKLPCQLTLKVRDQGDPPCRQPERSRRCRSAAYSFVGEAGADHGSQRGGHCLIPLRSDA